MVNIKAKLLDKHEVSKMIIRLSHEIVENNISIDNTALIGIRTRGDIIAKRIFSEINSSYNKELLCGTLDVTFYRDDFSTNLGSPQVGPSDINFDVNGKDIILIDDVLYTGRTIRAAMNEIFSFGRPNSIKLAVLVDRGHRELPIRPDFIGKNYPTANNEHIDVFVNEVDGKDEVVLVEYK